MSLKTDGLAKSLRLMGHRETKVLLPFQLYALVEDVVVLSPFLSSPSI